MKSDTPTDVIVAPAAPKDLDAPEPAIPRATDSRAVELLKKRYGFKKMPVTELLELRELGVGLHGTGITKTRVGVFVSQTRLEEILVEMHEMFQNAKKDSVKLRLADRISNCELRLNQIRLTTLEIEGVRRQERGKAPPVEPTARSFPPMVPVQINVSGGARVEVGEKPLATTA